jgi:hypothetical protein
VFYSRRRFGEEEGLADRATNQPDRAHETGVSKSIFLEYGFGLENTSLLDHRFLFHNVYFMIR